MSGQAYRDFERRLEQDDGLKDAVKDYQLIFEGFKGMKHRSLQQEISQWGPEGIAEEEELQISAYVEGSMDPATSRAFEEKMMADAGLKRRVAAARAVMQGFKGLQHEAFSREVAEWATALPGAAEKKEAKIVTLNPKKPNWWRLAAAATVLLLIATAFWLFSPFGQEAFSYTAFRETNYIEPATELIRGNEERLAAVFRNFAQEDYASVISFCLLVPPQDALFVTAQYLLGHSYYQTGRYQEAIDAFDQSLDPPAIGINYDRTHFNRDNAAWTRILGQLALAGKDPAPGVQQKLEVFLNSFLDTADRTDTYYQRAVELREELSAS